MCKRHTQARSDYSRKSKVDAKASLFTAERFIEFFIPGPFFTEKESEDLSQTEVLIQGLLCLKENVNHIMAVNQDHVVFT